MVQFFCQDILDKVFRKGLLAHVKTYKVISIFFLFLSTIFAVLVSVDLQS